MPDYLLDSNHASPLVTKSHPLRERVLDELRGGSTFAIPAPCITEVRFGISLLPRAAANLHNWSLLMMELTVYAVDGEDAERAAELQTRLRRQGRQLATVDALVAAVTLRYDRILLTTDRDFSEVPDLRSENWLSRARSSGTAKATNPKAD